MERVRNTWGFDALRPHQDEAIRASLAGRDAMVVLPTGGGKSLCYQAPSLVRSGLTVVVSPLISLMKDQLDGLAAHGVRSSGCSMSPSLAMQVNAAPGATEAAMSTVPP